MKAEAKSTTLPARFQLGDCLIEPSSLSIKHATQEIKIPVKVMQLLVILAEHQGQVVGREELLFSVWEETVATDDTLNTAIGKLRKALQDNPQSPVYLETIPKVGYRLIAKVESVAHRKEPNEQFTLAALLPEKEQLIWMLAAIAIISAVIITIIVRKPSTELPINKAPKLTPVTINHQVELHPSWSPDSNYVAFSRVSSGEAFRSQIIIRDLISGIEKRASTATDNATSPVWSPDGRYIAYISRSAVGCQIKVAASFSTNGLVVARCHSQTNSFLRTSLSWSADSQYIIFPRVQKSNDASALHSIKFDGTELTQLTKPDGSGFGDFNPAVSPDGKRLIFTRTNSASSDSIWSYQFADKSQEKQSGPLGFVRGISWKNENTLYFASTLSGQNGLWSFDLEKKKQIWVSTGRSSVMHPSYSASTNQVLVSDFALSENVTVGYRDSEGNLAGFLPIQSTQLDYDGQLSPDQHFLSYVRSHPAGSELWLYEINGSQQEMLFKHSSPYIGRQKWSPDARFFAFELLVNEKSAIYLFEIATRNLISLGNIGPSGQYAPAWSADSNSVYFNAREGESGSIWRYDLAKRKAERVFHLGGSELRVGSDGSSLLFKPRSNTGLWQLSFEEKQLKKVLAQDIAFWDQDDTYFYFTDNVEVPTKNIWRVAKSTPNMMPELYLKSDSPISYFDIGSEDMVSLSVTNRANGDIVSIDLSVPQNEH